MKVKIRKTDKRYTGSEYLKYVVDIQSNNVPIINGVGRRVSRIKDFQEIRDWCIQTWGMSCEREHYLTLRNTDVNSVNSHWCWHTEFYDVKIYLTSEKEANWFKLKWL